MRNSVVNVPMTEEKATFKERMSGAAGKLLYSLDQAFRDGARAEAFNELRIVDFTGDLFDSYDKVVLRRGRVL